jgi:hypothetical protein
MPKYRVMGRLQHDGQIYEPGDAVEIGEKAAAGLVAIGVLAPADGTAKGEDERKGKGQGKPAP